MRREFTKISFILLALVYLITKGVGLMNFQVEAQEFWTATPFTDENGTIIPNLEESVNQLGKESWLETKKQMPVTVEVNQSTGELIMKNDVIQRVFKLPVSDEEHFYTKSYKNLYTEQEFIRESHLPEVYLGLYDKHYNEIYQGKDIKISPEYYYIGGEDRNHRFKFNGYDIYDECEKSFEWQPTKNYSSPVASDWPPKGKRVVFHFKGRDDFKTAYKDISIDVIYEMYDGISAMKKRVEVKNNGAGVITVGKLAPVVLSVKEEFKNQVHLETTYICGDESTVPVNSKLPCGCKNEDSPFGSIKDEVHTCYELGPAYQLEQGEKFISFDTFELLHSFYWFEFKCKEIKGMYERLFPWTTDNPITFHCTSELTREKIDHAAEAGFEMIIQSYSARDYSNQMLTRNQSNLERYKQLVDYAHTKGIDIGIYQAQHTRSHYKIDSSYGKNDIGQWGTWCMASAAFDDYFDNFKHFIEYTGVDCVEIDGAYPGCACNNGEHHVNQDKETNPADSTDTQIGKPSKYKVHFGYHDSVVKQWENAVRLLNKEMKDMGVYVKVPAWYYLNGGNKGGIGYEEVAWSQPRLEQLIYGRQIIYNSSYGKNTSLSWSHIPFVQYHGGGDSASFTPFRDKIQDYNWVVAQNLGNGVTSDYRGTTLYDETSLPVMKKWVKFYKDHRGIINADMVKISQAMYPEGSNRQKTTKLDTLFHASSKNEKEKGLLWVYNQSDEERTETITVPMYYTGLTNLTYPSVPLKNSLGKDVKHYAQWPPNYSWIPEVEPSYRQPDPIQGTVTGVGDFVREGIDIQTLEFDSNGNAKLQVTLKPMSFTYFTIYEVGEGPSIELQLGQPTNLHLRETSEHTAEIQWDKKLQVEKYVDGNLSESSLMEVDYFEVYRDDAFVGKTISNTYKDEGLDENSSYQYYVIPVLSNIKGNASEKLTVQTLEDLQPPTVKNIMARDDHTIEIIFDERIDQTSAKKLENYDLSNDVVINNISAIDNIIYLTVNTLEALKEYHVAVRGIVDMSANKNTMETYDGQCVYGYVSRYLLDEIKDSTTQESIGKDSIKINNAVIYNDANMGACAKFVKDSKSYADLGTELIKDQRNFSLSLWFNTTDSSKQILLSQGQDEVEYNDFTLSLEDSIVRFTTSSNDATEKVVLQSDKSIKLGKWNHVVVTCNNGVYGLYLNGNKTASAEGSIDSIFNNTMYLGTITNSAGGDRVHFYNGYLSDVSIYRIGLTEKQVNGVYTHKTVVQNEILNHARRVQGKYYTQDSYQQFQECLQQAENTIANHSEDAIKIAEAISQLSISLNDLVKREEYTSTISIYTLDDNSENKILDEFVIHDGISENCLYMTMGTPFNKGLYFSKDRLNKIIVPTPICEKEDYSIQGWFKLQPRNNNPLTDEYTEAGKQVLLCDSQNELYIENGLLHFKSGDATLVSNKEIEYCQLITEKRQGWNSFSLVKENDNLMIYQNGEKVAEKESPDYQLFDSTLLMGASYEGNDYFNGILDEVVFYDQAITQQQIAKFNHKLSFDKSKYSNIAQGKGVIGDGITDKERLVDGKVLDLAGSDTPWTARKDHTNKIYMTIDLGKVEKIDAVSFTQFYRPFGKIGGGQEGFRRFNTVIRVSDNTDFTNNVKILFNNDKDNQLGLGSGDDLQYNSTELGYDIVLQQPVYGRYIRIDQSGFYVDDFEQQQPFVNIAELEIFQEVNSDMVGITDLQIIGEQVCKGLLTADYIFTSQESSEGKSEYQWFISDSIDGEYELIKPVHTKKIPIPTRYAGKYLKVAVIPKDVEGNTGIKKLSNPVGPIVLDMSNPNPNTDWFKEAGYGLSHHFIRNYVNRVAENEEEKILDSESWNDVVNGFDVEKYGLQVNESGAKFVIWILGQNDGYYISPNETYDQIADVEPGERTTTRDLMMEVIDELDKYGIKVILYLPSNPPHSAHKEGNDYAITKAFGYTPGSDTYPSQETHRKWQSVIKEWSLRYGEKIGGWWFDGAFRNNTNIAQGYDLDYANGMPYNWSSLTVSAKAGNEHAIVTYNSGVGGGVNNEYEDYCSGESNSVGDLPSTRWADEQQGVQWFRWTYLGEHDPYWAGWGNHGLSKDKNTLVNWVKDAINKEGVICLDTKVNRYGELNQQQLQQLKAVKFAVRQENIDEINDSYQNLTVNNGVWLESQEGEIYAPVTGRDEVVIKNALPCTRGSIRANISLGASDNQKQGFVLGWGNDTSDAAKQQGYEILLHKNGVNVEKSGIGVLEAHAVDFTNQEWVDLEVRFTNQNIKVFIDGTLVIDYTDNVNVLENTYMGLFATLDPYKNDWTLPVFRNVEFSRDLVQ